MCLGLLVSSCSEAKPSTPARTAGVERGVCADFELDVERFWSSSAKAQVSAGITNVGGDWTAEVRERVVTKMDAITRDWVMMQEGVCKDAVVRKTMSEEVYTKVSMCLRSALVSQRTIVTALSHASKDNVLNVDEALARAQEDTLLCEKEAIYGAYASDDEAAESARAKLAEARVYRQLKDGRARGVSEEAQRDAERSGSLEVKVDSLIEQAWQERARADFAAAVSSAQKSLQMAEQGSYGLGTATAYNILGVVATDQGDYPRALAMHEKALEIRRRVLGDNHPIAASSYNNLGIVYYRQGDYARAREMHGKALDIKIRALGEGDQGTANSYNNLGAVFLDQGDFARALEVFEKALVIKRRVFGENHPDTAAAESNVGTVYRHQGAYVKAWDMYEKALVIQRKVFGEDHPDTAGSYNNLGVVYYRRGDYVHALEAYAKALDIERRVLGESHPDTERTQQNIVELCTSGYQPACERSREPSREP